jgi:hypothetical protein
MEALTARGSVSVRFSRFPDESPALSEAEAPARTVRVAPDRLGGWLDRFAERHGAVEVDLDESTVRVQAADGAIAVITIPFPPLAEPGGALLGLVRQARIDRQIGAILVRRGGWAVGTFLGSELIDSKVGRPYVQGQTKAGGWSQQRYARRRNQQATQAYAATADAVARILLPRVADLEAVFPGGDRAGIDAVLADPRLAPVRDKLTGPVLPTPDPRLRVLQAFPEQFRAVAINLNELA